MLSTLLDKTGNLERQTSSKDVIGGSTKSWAAVQTGIACAIGPASYQNTRELERSDMIVESEIYTAVDVGARIEDRWLINGKYYLVLAYKPFENPIFGPPCYVTITGKRNQT